MIGHLGNLYLRKLPGVLAPVLLTTYLSEASEFSLKPADEILRLHLLAGAALDSGNLTIAHRAIETCGRLEPDSPARAELRIRLASLRQAQIGGRNARGQCTRRVGEGL